jgi:hypothetical protein
MSAGQPDAMPLIEDDFAVHQTASDLRALAVQTDRSGGVLLNELDRAGHGLKWRMRQIDPEEIDLMPIQAFDNAWDE